jgi:hypothetical protein
MSAPLEFALLHARQQDKSRVMPGNTASIIPDDLLLSANSGRIGRILKNRFPRVS